MRQLIADEKFTNIQRAQAGLTRLFKEAKKSMSFFRVMKGDKPLGVLVPNEMWEDFLEDLEALSSPAYLARIAKSRRQKKRYTMEEIKKELGL
ncbi:hypothetical protein HY087_01415 [Candidatus Gottesmanbacteria bacterium]|nr:hypothetical protein [Candidatus Gottesmanbacteria bacterium]